ncbi:MAG TPA: LL-diaminopimelate aminotransferase [Armatimonadota bacterium]|nr:LL-diaminopimelate aminotransferase [Armatimonadota bacterium]
MQIADRVLMTPPYPFAELARIKREMVAKGADLVDLGIGDPDRPTPPHIVEALCRAARDPRTHQYDETGAGLPAFREAVARWYEGRFAVELDPKAEVLRLIGSKEGLAHMLWSVLNPGDLALIPDPAYPVYKVNTGFAGGKPHMMPLLKENGYLPDLEAIPAKVAARAKIMMLCYPNMPTAAVAECDFYQRVVDFARKHDLLVCLDMAYSEIAFDGYRTHSLLQVPGAKDVAVEFHSLSKTYNMTGWRIGYAVGKPQALIALGKLKSNLDSGAFLAIQEAAVAALTGPQECVAEMLAIYQRRRDMLVEGLQALGWPVEKPKASFYVWTPTPEGYTAAKFAELLLNETQVLVTPGRAYGEQGEGFIRMALTVQGQDPQERIGEMLARIERKLELKWGTRAPAS